MSGHERLTLVLRLWSVDWVHNASHQTPPLAVLWQPVFGGIGYDDIVVRGLEAVQKGRARRWTIQKWSCDLRARDYFKPHMIAGELPSAMPPSPPPLDPDRPFA